MRKHLKLFTLLFTVAVLTTACSSDDDSSTTETDDPQQQVEDFVTPELLSTITDLGFEVNVGNNPPNVEGAYLAQPFELTATNRPNDQPIGTVFPAFSFTFFNQNSTSQTVEFSSEGGNQMDEGNGSLISGEGNQFTVFLKLESTINDHAVESIFAISGELEADGISNFQNAVFVLDDRGDPNDDFIENNQGRIFIDGDSFSELQ